MVILTEQDGVIHDFMAEFDKGAVVEGLDVRFGFGSFGSRTGTALVLERVERAVIVVTRRGAVAVKAIPTTQDEILDEHPGQRLIKMSDLECKMT
jgi:hypothetical protein